jgi:hypothetical protein
MSSKLRKKRFYNYTEPEYMLFYNSVFFFLFAFWNGKKSEKQLFAYFTYYSARINSLHFFPTTHNILYIFPSFLPHRRILPTANENFSRKVSNFFLFYVSSSTRMI